MYTTLLSSVTSSTEIDVSQYSEVLVQTSNEVRFNRIIGQVISTGAWGPVGARFIPEGKILSDTVWRVGMIIQIDTSTVTKIKFEDLTGTIDVVLRAEIGNNNNSLKNVINRLKDGDPIKILWIGDSLTAGTSSYAGPRDHFKSIMARRGYSVDHVGSLTTQNGNLQAWTGRDYEHDGVGGETLAQIGARISARVVTYDPDIVFVNGGANDFGSLTEQETFDNTRTIFSNARATKPDLPILFWGVPPRGGSTVTMDGAITPILNGTRRACRGMENLLYFDTHAYMARSWSQYFVIDGVHGNNIFYHRIALGIANCLVGSGRLPTLHQIQGTTAATGSISGDVEIPTGGLIQATGGTFNVVTWGGEDLTLVMGASGGLGTTVLRDTPFQTPICLVRSTGTTFSGSVMYIHRFAPGGLL